MSYSDKVHDVFASRGQAPALSGRFVLLAPLPLHVAWAGRPFRFQVEQDGVSKELRLFAKDVECERAGQYSAYLLATSGKQADLDRRMFNDGIDCESRPGFGMFRQLVRDGRARAL
jgi:hypothetical protein